MLMVSHNLQSFFPNVSSGYKIIENPQNLLYLQITSDTMHSITIWLAHQNENELNLRGENFSIRYHLREIKKYLELKNEKLHQC